MVKENTVKPSIKTKKSQPNIKVLKTGHNLNNDDLIYSCCRKSQHLTAGES